MIVFAFLINYNNSALSSECIDSLLDASVQGLTVYFVDNGSKASDYKSLVAHCSKRSVHYSRIHKNIGYSRAVNYALRIAISKRADYILTINNDCIVHPGSIKALLDTSRVFNNKCIVSGTIKNKATGGIDYIGQFKSKWSILTPSSPSNDQRMFHSAGHQCIEMGMLDDIMWLYPTKLIEDIGFYSPFFFLYGEQNNFALRALSAGYKLIYTPKAVGSHVGGATTAEGKKQSPRILYWQILGALKVYYLYKKKTFAEILFLPLRIYFSYLKHILAICFKRKNNRFRNLIFCFAALNLALCTFVIWSVKPYKDTGFNPFST